MVVNVFVSISIFCVAYATLRLERSRDRAERYRTKRKVTSDFIGYNHALDGLDWDVKQIKKVFFVFGPGVRKAVQVFIRESGREQLEKLLIAMCKEAKIKYHPHLCDWCEYSWTGWGSRRRGLQFMKIAEDW